MVAEVYLSGRQLSDGTCSATLSTHTILFVAEYCAPLDLKITLVEGADDASAKLFHISANMLEGMNFSFSKMDLLPEVIRNCQLPVIFDPKVAIVRSGLCCAVRHIVKIADTASPTEKFKDLLGFREGSLRMCAEVSGWTKLCEVELNQSLTQLVCKLGSIPNSDHQEAIELPQELLKLEGHFLKPPKIHNDDKLRRSVLSDLQKEFEMEEGRSRVLEQCCRKKSGFVLVREKVFPHGNRKFRLSKHSKQDIPVNSKTQQSSGRSSVGNSTNQSEIDIVKGDNSYMSKGNHSGQDKGDDPVDDLIKGIQSLTYSDVQMIHLYSEGLEITIADVILFVYMYHVMEALQFNCGDLCEKIPLIMKWLRHMVSLSRIRVTANTCAYGIERLEACLSMPSATSISTSTSTSTVTLSETLTGLNFSVPTMEVDCEDEMELSRRCRSKHKAYKPDVSRVLKKMQLTGIVPETGDHPLGPNVQLAWDSLPPAVHPKEGNVPVKRTERKCQQLENLATAVETLAQPGHVIVDFCSGGGHLGIVIAYLLPECKVYLIENKEESLMKAKHRVDALKLKNVVLYQCNMDYFHGTFDIGVSLHACGSATDMVLHQCLNSKAAFVICPCCYGSIQKTHLLSYPRSRMFLGADISYKDFLTLGHAADQTEFNMSLEEQGRYCSNLVDTDRLGLARERGYTVTLSSLQPRTCTPKNNLLIGAPGTTC